MELIRNLQSLHNRFPGSALTIGNFDGVHVGHQRVLAATVAAARAGGGAAVVFTFEPHPIAILRPELAPPRILTCERRVELFAAAGIDAVICPDQPRAVLEMAAEEFVRRVVVEAVGARVLVEGPDFAFGRSRQGTDEVLRRLGAELGFELTTAEAVQVDGQEVSSTRIRQAVREGRIAEANRMLGRPYEFSGAVVHGRRLGHVLGYPTINVAGGDFLVPAEGVYAGRAAVAAGTYAAAISVGRAETFGPLADAAVEAFLLDFDGDLYGQSVRLEFCHWLRGQTVFANAEELRAQVDRDCAAVRKLTPCEKC